MGSLPRKKPSGAASRFDSMQLQAREAAIPLAAKEEDLGWALGDWGDDWGDDWGGG